MNFRLSRFHPWRPVDWRYQRAKTALTAGQRLSRVRDDIATRRLYFVLRQLQACRNEEEESQLIHCDADTWLALEIQHDRELPMRAIVQARLLAGESLKAIGRKIGVKPGVISQYADCFFDVGSRLIFPDFIYSNVLAAVNLDVTERAQTNSLLLHLGYSTGSETLDQLTNGICIKDTSAAFPALVSRLEEFLERMLLHKNLAAMYQLNPAQLKAVSELFRLYARRYDRGRREASGTPAQIDYLKNVKAMTEQISWGIGPNTIPPDLREWSDTAVELRVSEQLPVSAGITLRDADELRRLNLRDPEKT